MSRCTCRDDRMCSRCELSISAAEDVRDGYFDVDEPISGGWSEPLNWGAA